MRVFTNKNRQQRQNLNLATKKSDETHENHETWRQNSSKVRQSVKRLTTVLVENLKLEQKKRKIDDQQSNTTNSEQQFSDAFQRCWADLRALNAAYFPTGADSVACPCNSSSTRIEFNPPFLESVEFLQWCGVRAARLNYRLSFNAMWSRLLSATLRRLFSRTEFDFPSEPQTTVATTARRTESSGGITVPVNETAEKIPQAQSEDTHDGIEGDFDENQATAMVGRGKKLPNYFVALPIKSEEIIRNINVVQKTLIERQPLLKQALIPLETTHITLMVMHLDEEHCLHDAKKAMHLLADEWRRTTGMTGDVSLTFDRIGNFRNGDVVFAQMVKDDEYRRVEKLAELTRECFARCGIVSTDKNSHRSFTPHLTIAKMRNSRWSKNGGIKKIRPEWYDGCFTDNSNTEAAFGTERVNTVQLLSILKPKNPKTWYYYCAKELTFG